MSASVNKLKYRLTEIEGHYDFKMLLFHPMETGLRQDYKTGQFFPANYLENIKIQLNKRPLMSLRLGIHVSANPYFHFQIKTIHAGDVLYIEWWDNRGQHYDFETKVVIQTT